MTEEQAYNSDCPSSREEVLCFLNELGWLFRKKLASDIHGESHFSLPRFKFLLVSSVERGYCFLVRALLDMMVEINLGSDGLMNKEVLDMLAEIRLLNRAVKKNTKMAETLIHYSVNPAAQNFIFLPSIKGSGDITPLHLAALTCGSVDIIDVLTNDPQKIGLSSWNTLMDASGKTSFSYAAMRNNHSYNILVARKLADRRNGQIPLKYQKALGSHLLFPTPITHSMLGVATVILGEEVTASKLTIFDITKQICDAVQARAVQGLNRTSLFSIGSDVYCSDVFCSFTNFSANCFFGPDKNHGVILFPEGIVESIPELHALLNEIHGLLKEGGHADNISTQLSPWSSASFEFLPPFIKKHVPFIWLGTLFVFFTCLIDQTQKLLAYLVETNMNKSTKEGRYKTKKFNAICHFFGYQARRSLPSKFNCDYAYVLGDICYHILAAGLNGYMATVTNLQKSPVNKSAAPMTAMMTVKRWSQSSGSTSIGRPVIHPATVDLKGKAYKLLRQNAQKFLMEDVYRNAGLVQYDGPSADVEDMLRIEKMQEEYLDQVLQHLFESCQGLKKNKLWYNIMLRL
ncbi:unnamed protein product [Eruca vesicaria subsp. sativa]|uniref:Uncharacterized protein n=1 Tax=Eruca vesicaria subsp. sativa TaxID=29727 RepID=A0ABC8LF19_ERUVS|nr:unnamed protein product [Eruca vesicaria subsp. sativa]